MQHHSGLITVVAAVRCANEFNGEMPYFAVLTLSAEAQAQVIALLDRLNTRIEGALAINAVLLDIPAGMSCEWTRRLPSESFNLGVALVGIELQDYSPEDALPSSSNEDGNHVCGIRGDQLKVTSEGRVRFTAYCKYSGDSIETDDFTFDELSRLVLESDNARSAVPMAA